MKETLARSALHYEDEKRGYEAVYKELETKIHSCVEQREEEAQQKRVVQEQNVELRVNIDTLRGQVCRWLSIPCLCSMHVSCSWRE